MNNILNTLYLYISPLDGEDVNIWSAFSKEETVEYLKKQGVQRMEVVEELPSFSFSKSHNLFSLGS